MLARPPGVRPLPPVEATAIADVVALGSGSLMSNTPTTPAGSSLVLPTIALLAVLALSGALLLGGDAPGEPGEGAAQATRTGESEGQAGQDGQEGSSDDQSEALAALERREEDDPRALGDVDAPVVMIEWADFQCPFCGAFARDTKPELVDRYVAEGILRIEWRDLPLLGPESRTAALAGRAAAEQDAFWDLHDRIYAQERERNAGELSEDALLGMAEDLGLDVGRFAEDLGDPAHEESVEQDLEIARQLGVTGTPAFLVNGQLIVGGQPTEVFARAIEQAAEAAGA